MSTASLVARAALKRARVSRTLGTTLSTPSLRLGGSTNSNREDEQQPPQSMVFWHQLRSKSSSSQVLANEEDITQQDVSVLSKSAASSQKSKSPNDRQSISKKEMAEEESKRWRLSDVPISDILKAKNSNRWVDPVISKDATIKDAIEVAIDGGLSAAMVVDEEKRVVGLISSRDLLRCIALGMKEGESNDEILNRVVSDHVMTPISQVIYARPEETVGMCRTIMAKLGIKCLPVLSKEGRVEGLVTARDMNQYRFSAEDKGGKKNFLNDVSERVGLGTNTSMADPPAFMQAHLALEQNPLFINVGVAELPHPFKTDDGVGMSHREFGPHEFSTNPDLSEDAYFVKTVSLPDEKYDEIRDMTYLGVADGVGSWREFDVDPRDFSHALMGECESVLVEAAANALQPKEGGKSRRGIRPGEVLAKAYERVKERGVIGSSTACVALFDNIRHQLHFSNLGDSGIIVLRHIDSDVAGALKRNRKVKREERKSDLQAVFVSQQQLHSFNHPFQLGWTGKDLDGEEETSFSSPRNSCTTSIHVRRGDVIIMATDGLFDNVDIDEICSIALQWEQQNGFVRGGDIDSREKRWFVGNSLTDLSYERIPHLSEVLVKKARENSLDPTTDSPFAVLAKENDIMWSGGMPDDCTVIAMHVVGRAPPAHGQMPPGTIL